MAAHARLISRVDELRFDDRVAIVTGSGRGLGRAYAHLLGARGAAVVVNDLGGSIGGGGTDPAPASLVAEEIVAAGGRAIADASDVADADGAQTLVDATIDAFGKVDVVVNNAGIMRWADFPDVAVDDVDRHLAVHVGGSFNTTRSAWPHLVEQRYGRVVMTTSAGLFGLPNNTAYATAKGGVVGLTRSLALAGAPHGIAVNAVAPAAWTRMAGPPSEEGERQMAPDLVAPMVAFLAHEQCPVNGEIYAAGARRFARLFIACTSGYVDDGGTPSVEDVAASWSAINDEIGYAVPADLTAWSARFTSHLPPSGS